MMHPSNRLNNARSFEPSSMDGREAFAARRAAGKGIAAGKSPGTRRARVVREIARCICPIARWRARPAASGMDAEPFRASRSRGRESSQWNRPERAGRGWYVRWCSVSVRVPGRRVRLQAVLNGRTRSLSVSRAAGKVRDTRDGVLRLRHIRPVARTGGIRGGEHGLRL